MGDDEHIIPGSMKEEARDFYRYIMHPYPCRRRLVFLTLSLLYRSIRYLSGQVGVDGTVTLSSILSDNASRLVAAKAFYHVCDAVELNNVPHGVVHNKAGATTAICEML